MIVNCVAYESGQRLADIPLNEVRAHLRRRGCFVWVALKDPEPAELAAVLLTAASQDLEEAPAGEVAAEALVIGIRHRSQVGKLLMGSVATRLLMEATCPVIAVKPQPR